MFHQAAKSASRSALADELLRGSSITLTIQNTSMLPAIRPGDRITVKPFADNKLHQGSILLIEYQNEWIAHRLMSLRLISQEIHAITRGDNADSLDMPVHLKDIKGIVIELHRNGQNIPLNLAPVINNFDDLLLMASFPSELQNNSYDIACSTKWETFIEAADREYLTQLIYFNHRQRISDNSATTIPANAASHLKNAFMTSLACNVLYLEELQILSDKLEGIDFILLKGAYLASCIYESPGVRVFSDIDILIKPSDFEKVHAKLAGSGYKPFPEIKAPSPIVSNSPYLNSFMYTSMDKKISLHVHWHLLNSTLPLFLSTKMPMDDIWKYARKVNNPFMELCPEHLIIHLAEHAVRHSFDRLILIRDIAEVLNKFSCEIKWDKLIQDSLGFKLSRPVYYSLLMTVRKTAAHVPEDVLDRLAPAHQGFAERLFMKLVNSGTRESDIGSLIYFSSSSLKDKAILAWRLAFPPKIVLAAAYNMEADKITLIVYFRRLFRGIQKAAGAIKTFLTAKSGDKAS